MSIYATWLHLGLDHEHECAKWVEEKEPDCFRMDNSKPCTCGLPRSPFIYQGSHVLPAESDPKGGSVLVCGIPDHITREGRDDAPEGALKDWLRLSVYGGDKNAVVLARRHVEELRDTLTAWLDRGCDDDPTVDDYATPELREWLGIVDPRPIRSDIGMAITMVRDGFPEMAVQALESALAQVPTEPFDAPPERRYICRSCGFLNGETAGKTCSEPIFHHPHETWKRPA